MWPRTARHYDIVVDSSAQASDLKSILTVSGGATVAITDSSDSPVADGTTLTAGTYTVTVTADDDSTTKTYEFAVTVG